MASLVDSINEAAEKHAPAPVVDVPVDETKDEKVTEPEKTEAPVEDFSADDLKAAKDLFKALKDPAQSKAVIEVLAKTAGLLGEAKTEAHAEAVEDAMLAKVRKHLGEENEWLTPKIAALLKDAIKDQVAEAVQDIREENARQREEKATNDAYQATQKLAEKYSDVDEPMYGRMMAEMENLKPGKLSIDEYFEKLYILAGGTKAAKKAAAEPIRKTSPDPVSQLGSAGKGSVATPAPGSTPMSLRDAVEFATKEATKKK
jgi:hypothetical protein